MTRPRFTIRSLGIVLVLGLMLAAWQADTDTAWVGYERGDWESARLPQGLGDDPPALPVMAMGEQAASAGHIFPMAAPRCRPRSTRASGSCRIRGSPGGHRS